MSNTNDLISRKAAIDAIEKNAYRHTYLDQIIDIVSALPSAQPEEFEWCHDCKEYDKQAHCCHRWTKVIRNTVKELKAERKGKWIKQNPSTDTEECSECGYNIIGEEFETPFCPWCGADMRKPKLQYGDEDALQGGLMCAT